MIKSIKELPADQLFSLYQSVNWVDVDANPKEHGELLAKVYAGSDLVFSCWEDDHLVGAVRAITDQLAHGIIYGLAVDPAFQNRGIAKQLVAACLNSYPDIQWETGAETSGEGLFENLGFTEAKNKHLTKGSCSV